MWLDTPGQSRRLLIPSKDFVEILEPATPNLSVQPLANLKAAVESRFTHRVKVSGAVTYRDPDVMVIQEGATAAQVRNAEPTSAVVGDSVEVVGFPEQYNSLL